MNDAISNEYSKSYVGLLDLSKRVRAFAYNFPLKIGAMEEKFLDNTPLYSDAEKRQIKYLREAYVYKFYLSILHLEQLWALEHIGKRPPSLKDVLSNVFDCLQIDEDNLLLPSFAMEGFIIQGSTFLDFYFQYICALFKTRLPGGKMPFDQRIFKALSEVETPFTEKAQSVSVYCKKNIFNNEDKGNLIQGNWGGLIKLLRNQVVHRDSDRPNYQTGKEILDKIFSRLPENKNVIPLTRFCQELQNGMFYQITSLSETIYGLEWKPGPYKTGMWDSFSA